MTANGGVGERAFLPISNDDLRRLGRIAAADRESLFQRRPEIGRLYRNRLIAVALCQGAALHRVSGTNGVKDFDVWGFFAEHPERPFPARRNATADFGNPKFGTSPGWEHFRGRRVDLIGRSLPVTPGADPISTLQEYLRAQRTKSARHLAEKAVVLIEPLPLLGHVVWLAEGATSNVLGSERSRLGVEDRAGDLGVPRLARSSPSDSRIPTATELRGHTLRIRPEIFRSGNPRQPFTHGWLAFEILRLAEGGALPFDEYHRRLFDPTPEIRVLAQGIPGVPNAYQDLKHIRHDIRYGRILVE